ncbi:MAG TPA: ankyrin repeat domain-containing protein, partial [Gammaproteobacteria bacterium]|nr:ankyrin repeat domain-containing protein [Gammaproteobacteria bacterium]
MSNIHPFDRAKEFPNYFEIMLKSVPEGERDAFVKKIQKLIEQNISTIVKRLKLYYVYKKDESDPGELSTADYFNELVKSMEHALKESPAKDDYNLEVYLSGGVVRTLLGYVYRQLHTNIQEVFEDEFEAAKKSTEPDQAKQQALENVFKREAFLKTFTETPEFWLQKLKMEQSKLQNSYVLGVGSDMDILYKLSPRTVRSESKLNGAQLEKLHEVLWHENALNNTQKKALYKAVKEQTLNEAQLKDLQKAIKNQYQLYEEELQGLQQAIEATKKLDKEQLDEAQSQALSDTEKTARKQYELHRQELQDLEQAIDNLHKLPERALKESQELYETIKELMETDKKRLENLDQAIKNGGALDLDKKQWKILKQAINNLGNLTGKELKELQKAIYDKSPLTQEQQQVLDLAIKNQHKLNNEQWGNLKQAIQSGSELNTEQLQKLHRAINIQSKLKLKGIKEKVQAAGDLFINSAANFFNLSDVEETLKNSLLPPGDVNEYTKQTTSSMSQGGSALDWLAFEISPKTGRKLIEPPSDLKQQAQMSESIVEGFIRGHFEYLEPQIAETTARRTASIVRGLRALFEIPFLKIKDEAVILREMQDMENLATRDDQGNIILPPRTPKQLEKLRRNTPFEGAYNRATRPDPESTVLSTFLGISKQFAPAADGRMNVHFPKYVQSVKALDKTPASGLYQAAIDSLLVNKETFEEHFTDAGTLYHGTPLNAVTAIIRGGFYISDSTQGAAIYGSGLYSSKDRAVALGYGDGASVLPLHIDPKAKIINLDTMDPQLLEDLKAEAKKDGFLDVKGEAEVNELLKTRYNIDVIINTHVIIQNSAVIKPIQLSDLSVTYGAQFETQFMSNVQLGDKSFRLISENINLTTANKFFEHYTNLCLLSGTVETDSLSPVKIIRNLVTNVEQIENTQPTFKSHNTQLFIYTHCFSAKPDYVMAHLTDIFKYSNNNPDIMKALEKFTQGFATSFKKGNKEEHETLVAILKNLILYSNTNDLIIGTLNELKRIEPQELIGALNALIFSAEITQTQALYFLAKIDDEALQKNYLTLFDLEKPENNKRLAELSAVRALTIEEIYKQHPKEIFENVNLQDAQGNTYLLHSCSTGTDADVHKISKLHADLNFFDKNGKTALWMAIENKNITDECIIEMIQNSIVDLNYVYNNETAILSACTAKRDTLVAYLLSNHAINLNIKKQGLNILHLASQNGLEKTIPLLLNKHSNMFNLNQLDNSLNTPLMLAIESAQH